MKTSELIKLLKNHGAYLERHGSSHDIWHSTITGKSISVPRHKKEIAPGTAKNVLKDAGIKQNL